MSIQTEKTTKPLRIDAVDIQILDLLQANAKMTTKEIAAQLSITTTPVYERIKRLEKTGIIKSYATILNRVLIDKSLMAICMVQLSKHAKEQLEKFESEALKIPEVIECFHVAGQYEYFLKVIVADMNEYQHFIVNKLSIIANVGNVQSSFVMKELKNETRIILTHTH